MSILLTHKFLGYTAKSTLALGVALGMGLSFSQGAQAEPRQVSLGATSDAPSNCSYASSCSLQDLLDSITTGGPGIDTANDQTSYSYFTNTATGGSLGSFMFEVAGFAGYNEFGIYKQSNPLKRATLYSGINDWGDRTVVDFLANGSLSVSTKGLAPDYEGPTVDSTYADFGNAFGFYVTNGNGKTFYSDDLLNPGEKAQALIYQGDNATTLELPGKAPGLFVDSEYIIAFEDGSRKFGADGDFNDLVVMMESIQPVPEPATLAGLGLVGSLLAFSRRRQGSKTG